MPGMAIAVDNGVQNGKATPSVAGRHSHGDRGNESKDQTRAHSFGVINPVAAGRARL